MELSSDFYAQQSSWAQRIDARVKLLSVMSAIVAVVSAQTPLFPLVIMTAACGMTISAGVPLRYIVVRFGASAATAAIVALVHAVTTGVTPLATFSIGPVVLRVTHEGVCGSVVLLSRIFGAISLIIFLGATTSAPLLFRALRWLRVPAEWVEIAGMMYRSIFLFFEAASDILVSQRVRLGYATWRSSIRSLAGLSGAILIRSLDQAVRTAESMKIRGYTGQIASVTAPPVQLSGVGMMITVNAIVWGLWLFVHRTAVFSW